MVWPINFLELLLPTSSIHLMQNPTIFSTSFCNWSYPKFISTNCIHNPIVSCMTNLTFIGNQKKTKTLLPSMNRYSLETKMIRKDILIP